MQIILKFIYTRLVERKVNETSTHQMMIISGGIDNNNEAKKKKTKQIKHFQLN